MQFFCKLNLILILMQISQTQKQPYQQIKLKGKNSIESKKNYEFLWKVIFLFISLASSVLIGKIYRYQTSEQLKEIRKGHLFELIIYGVPFGAVFIFLQTLAHKYFDPLCGAFYINQEKYKTQQARKKRCYTLVKWAFSIIYYIISSISAYNIIKKTSFMPTWLGGNGECTDLLRYFHSFDEANFYMQIYYVLQFGKHLGRFFHHCFIKPEGNYYEYALHHGLSTFLIFFSYLTNQWMIGIFVLLIHDVSDIALSFGRGYRDYKKIYKPLLTVFDIIGGSSWILCRIILLSYCCVYSSILSASQLLIYPQKFNPIILDIMLFPGFFMAFMLFALQIMQLFWTYYIFSSIIAFSVSQKLAKHTYD